jgi:ankyrin repeat protein
MLRYIEYIKEARDLRHPFIQAAVSGNNNKVKEFIKSGIDINMKDKDGRTALMNAVMNNFLMVVITLIDAGANPNLQDKDGRTALMMASTNKIMDKLFEAGADVNIKNLDGNNFLVDRLDYFGSLDDKIIYFFEKLVSKGIDLKNKNRFGENFYDVLIGRSEHSKQFNPERRHLLDFRNYVDENYPQFKEEWEMRQNVNKYNL